MVELFEKYKMPVFYAAAAVVIVCEIFRLAWVIVYNR